MPHIVMFYTASLDQHTDMGQLCRQLADTLIAQRDEADAQVFPTGGTRVFAYPAPHSAIADGGAAGKQAGGDGDYDFLYINLRMGAGRSPAVHKRVGDALLACARAHLEPVFATRHLGLTVQVDAAPGQVFDGKHSTLHPLFAKPEL